MNYIIIGLLLSIGWHSFKLIYEILSEIIFCRLHKADSYAVVCGKTTKNSNKVTSTVKTKIGF